MFTARAFIISLTVIALFAAGMPGAAAQSLLKDISGTWAREHIEFLTERGVIRGYPDQTFRPDRTVTRAEFAKMATAAFKLEKDRDVSFSDVDGHWARQAILELGAAGVVEGDPNGRFRPDDPINRAEVVSILVRVLKLHDVTGYADQPSFTDLPRSHWAYDAAETALRLKILPPYFRGEFKPQLPVTRAETAAMIAEVLRLQQVRGTLDYLEPETGVLGVRTEAGPRDFTLGAETIVHRNTTVAPLTNLVVGDAVLVVLDRYGTPQFVKANGVVTQADVVTKVSGITRGLLTPNDLRLIIRGEWDALGESLKNTIYNQLLERGLSPVEAAAIMERDWASLKEYARDRLAQVIAAQLGVTTDLAIALLDRDWERARELAQIEAVEHLLARFLMEGGADS